ncbi:MAG: histone deacetylase [Desulfosudis oleivorans]|nr:histone deacetylase [Desulfosudis oleivorans]
MIEPSRRIRRRPRPATEAEIAAVHTAEHIERIRRFGLYEIAALAAGGAIQAADDRAGGALFRRHPPARAPRLGRVLLGVLLLQQHGGGDRGAEAAAAGSARPTSWTSTCTSATAPRTSSAARTTSASTIPGSHDRAGLSAGGRAQELERLPGGRDRHLGRLRQPSPGLGRAAARPTTTTTMGRMVRDAARRNGGGCFAVLEGGYNHDVLGQNALALINGLST